MRAFCFGCAVVLTALLVGCVSHTPPVQYSTPHTVSVLVVVDDLHEKASRPAPPSLTDRVVASLSERNLTPRVVAPDQYESTFGTVRDSSRRLAHQSAATDSELALLVEAQAEFYSHLAGRYRWTVFVKLSVVGGQGETPLSEEFDVPAVLSFSHESEDDALALVSKEVARRAGLLVDSYLSGRVPVVPAPSTDSPEATSADSIYFVLVDRFHNGDPANDGEVATEDPAGWHGGDLQGVVDQLDYLRDLGVKTLWLSPIFRTRYSNFMGHGAFHGYWVEDLAEVDPRFGDEALLKHLVDEAHARGMRIVLDLVVNHVGYEAPMLTEHPEWFHHEGTIENWNDAVEVTTHEVHGLPDLAQEREEVYQYLWDTSVGWLESTGIDGFRLDAVKHVPLAFWTRFNGELQERGDLVLLGELYDGSPTAVDDVQREGRFTHMFDFPTAFALRDVFCEGRPVGRIASVLSNDRLYTDPRTLVTFLDNHDVSRVSSLCSGDSTRVRAALTAQFALRGTPALTYGTESGLEGIDEPHNRPDMRFEKGRLYEHVAELLRLRQASPALVSGSSHILAFDGSVMVLARVLGDSGALLLINGTDAPATVPIDPRLADVALRDALSGEVVAAPSLVLPAYDARILASDSGFGALNAPAAQRVVEVAVTSAAGVQASDSLLLVGSAPELGAWSPDAGVALSDAGERYVASLELPVGLVFAYKLVVRGDDGTARWEQGDDRYLFVEDGSDPLRIELSLRT